MTSLAPSTTIKKKARRVFGDVAVMDDDYLQQGDRSLTYSPSPCKTLDEEDDDDDNAQQQQQQHDEAKPSGNSTSNTKKLSPLIEDCNSSRSSSSSSSSSTSNSSASNSTKNSTDSQLKENNSNRTNSSDSSSINNNNSDITTIPAKKNTHKQQLSIQERVRNMRQQQRSPFRRSPLRRDLVQKTQAAINKASRSINHSLTAALQAKQAHHVRKSRTTANVRRNWQRDTTEAKAFQQQAEKNRREILSLQRQLSSQCSQQRARQDVQQRLQMLQKLEEESQFQSQVFREHQRALRQEKDETRRRSVAARAQLRANHREGTEKLRQQEKEEEQAIWEERYESSVAQQTFQKRQAQKRRQSFAFRRGDARRIRELHATMQAEALQQEHASFELKWAGEKDAEDYQRQLAQARRDSLAGRNAHAKKQRDQESQQLSEQSQADHESYELKWAGERDAEAYQRKLQEERRQSLAGRNQHGRRQREQAHQEHFDALAQEHESYELKWAGEKDAEEYQRQLEKQRRDSFAFRHQEGKRQRDLEQQQNSEQMQAEHESYELKWGGEKDAEEYQRLLEKQRRQSLAGRNLEGRRQRLEAEQGESEALLAEHQSYELKWAGERDAEAYQRKVERLRRESLARRNAESVHHAQVMEELRVLAREQETESYVLKWAGEKDAKDYLARMAEERRQSLQLRGKQTVHHRQVESEQHDRELMQAHQDEDLRAKDQKEVEAYRAECAERDRKSLEYRRKEARAQRIQEEERLLKQQERDAQGFALESDAHRDVEEYVKECKQRRRLSLAFRAKEKRHHARWTKEQRERELDHRSSLVHDRLMDQRHVELARQQERAKSALNALRHGGAFASGNSNNNNPFATVLFQ